MSEEKKELVLVFKTDGSKEFVSCSSLLSEFGHYCGRVSTDGYYILHGNCISKELKWLETNFLKDGPHNLSCGIKGKRPQIYPGNILIRIHGPNHTDMTIDKFKEMINTRVPNPTVDDTREINKLLEGPKQAVTFGWCTIL